MNEREIQERAAYWLIESEDPKLSGAQRERMLVWLNESPRHQEVYDALAQAWQRTLILRKVH